MAYRKWLGQLLLCWLISTAASSREAAAEVPTPTPAAPHLQTAALEVLIDRASVDLERHRLELRMSRPAGHVKIKVIGHAGGILAEDDLDFSGRPAGSLLVVTWKPKSAESAVKIEVYAYDADGYFKGIAITPWSFEVPHEEVTFATNSAELAPTEVPKLQASLAAIKKAFEAHKDLGPVTLFIAGNTDTRGSAEHNRDLSRRRARAIAGWFRANGLRMPIGYAGLGEEAPKVRTADETDEPKNRRVDYVLSIDPPRFKASGKELAWNRL